MTSPEAIFTYSELRGFLKSHLGKAPAPSTLSAWMQAVLDLPEYNRQQPRQYLLEEAMALVFWACAGEKAKRGDKKTRAIRRRKLYREAVEQWQSKI